MKFFYISYVVTLILCGILLALVSPVIASYFTGVSHVVVPVPEFLSQISNKQVSTLSLFLPSIFTQKEVAMPSSLSAQSALLFDIKRKETLFEKNSKKRLPMASLTKIMTAIVALENRKEDDTYVVRNENLVGENSMGLSSGEVLSLEELLYGLLLPSGNDAAETLASNYPLGRTAFIHAMNQKAQSLGLSDTHFTNPSGLQGDGIQYTTAYDLLVMTQYALSHFPEFAKVVSTASIIIPPTDAHKEFTLHNDTNLLTSYEGVKGVKTGYTPEAGLCLVSYLDYRGEKIIGVLLGSEDRRGEMASLLDYSVAKLGLPIPKKKL